MVRIKKTFIIDHYKFFFLFFLSQEWGSSCPHEALGAYRLEADMSWTKAEDVERRSKDIAMVDHLLSQEVPAIEYVLPAHDNNGFSTKPAIKHKTVIEDVSNQADPIVEEPH